MSDDDIPVDFFLSVMDEEQIEFYIALIAAKILLYFQRGKWEIISHWLFSPT